MDVGLGLDALNFALAGAREGFGPFLGVYLQKRGFEPELIGLMMGVAGVAGLIATTPIGALIDRARNKRLGLISAVCGIAIGSTLLVVLQGVWLVAAAQAIIGIADASIAPFVAAFTLGTFGPEEYGARVSRNEAFNHAGNAANAVLAGALGYAFGLGYVAAAIVAMAAASSLVVSRLDPRALDDRAAKGGDREATSMLSALSERRALLALAGAAFFFQTANGAILSFLAQSRAAVGSDPSLTTAALTVIAQCSMAAVAVAFANRARNFGALMSIALLSVLLRGLLAAAAQSWWLLASAQALDGVASGLLGIAAPALTAEVMAETGHANAGLGAVMTAYGAGAALSPIIAGACAERFGFRSSFIVLSLLAAVGLLFWIVGSRRAGLKPLSLGACKRPRDG